MAYTFTITEVTPTIGLTVNPAAQFTATQQSVVLNVSETQPQFNITNPANNEFTVNDDGYIFTLTNVDAVVTLTQNPSTTVTLTNAVSTINVVTSATNINVQDAPQVVYTATTQISQIQTENMATVFKGEFTSTDSTIYYRGHIVRYNQNIYVATVDPGERITNPAAPPGNPQWTLVFSQTGLTGWQVDAMEKAYNIGPWTAGATYVLYSWVSYNGYIWQLNDLAGTYGSEPSLSNPYWSQIGSQGDQALFTTSSVTFKDLTLTGKLTASAGVVTNFTVTNRLQAGGIKYPITPGLYGQVLTTNGVNEANWTDVVSTGTGSLRPATRDNLGGVIIGTGLNVTESGVISITTGTNGANIGWNLTDDLRTNGYNIVTGIPQVINENFPVPKLEIGSGLTGQLDSALIFDARTTSTSQVRLIGDTVIVGSGNPYASTLANGIRFATTGTFFIGNTLNLNANNVNIGTNTTTSVTIGNSSSTNSILIAGKIQGTNRTSFGYYTYIGDNLKVSGYLLGATDSTPLKVNKIQFLDGTIIESGNTLLPYATTTSSGVIKVGQGLVMNNGFLNAIQYTLPTASDTVLGGIKIGAGLAINGQGVVSVTTTSEFVLPLADENTIGGVYLSTSSNTTRAKLTGLYSDNGFITGRVADTQGLGMVYIENNSGITTNGLGALYLARATTNSIGGVKIDGTTIVMDVNGVISAPNSGSGSTGTGVIYYAGSGIAINTLSNIISVTSATTSTIGGVIIGNGLQVNNGLTSIKLAPGGLYIDGNGALNVASTASSGVIDLSADAYTNGYIIRYNTSTNSLLNFEPDKITMQVDVPFWGTSQLKLGDSARLSNGRSEYLNLNPGIITLQAGNDSYLKLDIYNGTELQSNADAYKLTLNGSGASIVKANDANAPKLVIGANQTILSNPSYIGINAPDTRFGSSLYDSRIYAAVILNYSGTGPPLLAEGVQYGDLSVQRTAWPGYNYGQVIKSNIYGPSVPQDFNNLSLAVDFNR